MSRAFIWGVVVGACVMAAMDVGDVWFCMGECGDFPVRIWEEPTR